MIFELFDCDGDCIKKISNMEHVPRTGDIITIDSYITGTVGRIHWHLDDGYTEIYTSLVRK